MMIMMMVEAMVMIKCSKLGKEEREKQKSQGKGIIDRSILFWRSRHLESVVTFRIDSHTIKMGETYHGMQLSKCH
jgi:hypothetical protein